MALYRNSILQQPPVTFSEAGHIRRSSVHSVGRTSILSGGGEGPCLCALVLLQRLTGAVFPEACIGALTDKGLQRMRGSPLKQAERISCLPCR